MTWPTVPLKRIARLNYGDALPSDVRSDGEVPVVGSGGPSGFHDVSNTAGPAIVIGRKGSYGSIHWEPRDCFVIDTAYAAEPLTSATNLRWLYYALQAVDFKGTSQDVGVPGLSRDAAYSVRLPVVSDDEQSRIANFLDAETSRIDDLTAKQLRMVDVLEQRRVAITSHLIFGRTSDGPKRDSTIPAVGPIPATWQVVRNKAFLREVMDLSQTGHEELLSVSHITGVTPRSAKDVHMFMAESMVGYKICQPGDLVINTLWACCVLQAVSGQRV